MPDRDLVFRFVRNLILPAAAAVLMASLPIRAADRPAVEDKPYARAAEAMRAEGLKSEGAFAVLERLLRLAPSRLTGSPGFAAAQEVMAREMEALGMTVRREPAVVEHWQRGRVQEAVVLDGAEPPRPLRIAALGLSVSTPPGGLEAPVVEIRSFEELKAAAERVKGAIVFFNHPMDRTLQESFAAYGEVVEAKVSCSVP